MARSSGTLKPFFYALALERGTITPTTILDDLDRGVGGITNSTRVSSDRSYPASRWPFPGTSRRRISSPA